MVSLKPEVIGPPDCPIIYRWTLLKLGDTKLLLHRFPPNADDRDMHDHPRPFWTVVLRGGYDDLVPCGTCGGQQWRRSTYGAGDVPCEDCFDGGMVPGDRLRAGDVRRRAASYTHRTRVLPEGAWTLVLMGPLRRRWGFWRGGRWWFWKDYEEEFGYAMRCEDLNKEHRR
jgi:hypothetical protein